MITLPESSGRSEDGGSTVLRYVGILQHHYMVTQTRRPCLEETLPTISVLLRGIPLTWLHVTQEGRSCPYRIWFAHHSTSIVAYL